MYSQFVYGKLNRLSPDQVIARTPDLKNTHELKSIAEKYKFWQSDWQQRSRRNETIRQAVGIVKDPNSGQLLLIQAKQIKEGDAFYDRYRYVFIPLDDFKKLAHCTDQILHWFSSVPFPAIHTTNVPLEKLPIPLLDSVVAPDYSQETEDIITCLQEKYKRDNDDENPKPYLISALLALLNGQHILINSVINYLAPTKYLKSIIRLLPASCRTDLSIVVGDFNQQSCHWAKLLVKVIDPQSINEQHLPRDFVWLCRQQEKLVSSNQREVFSLSPYAEKIEKILLQPERHLPDRDWIEDLLKDLDNLTDQKFNLSNLNSLLEENRSDDSSSNTIKLGLWGIAGSGKTIYITKLYESLQKDSSCFIVNVTEEKSVIFLTQNAELLNNGVMVAPTEPLLEKEFLKTIQFTIEASYTLFKKFFTIQFVDAPGGYYEKIGAVEDGKIKPPEGKIDEKTDLVDYLVQCDGIIFLLKPDAPMSGADAQPVLIPRVLEALRRCAMEKMLDTRLNDQKRLKQFMAFCVTQVDKENEYWKQRENAENLVKKVLGTGIQRIGNACLFSLQDSGDYNRHRCQFFALSSIGRYKDKDGNECVAVEYDNASFDSNNWDMKKKNSNPLDNFFGRIDLDAPPLDETTPLESEQVLNQEDSWFDNYTQELQTEDNQQSYAQGRLKQGVNPEPFNVIEPVKWLIRSIQAHPLEDNQKKNT